MSILIKMQILCKRIFTGGHEEVWFWMSSGKRGFWKFALGQVSVI
jgi:hypothetical protein